MGSLIIIFLIFWGFCWYYFIHACVQFVRKTPTFTQAEEDFTPVFQYDQETVDDGAISLELVEKLWRAKRSGYNKCFLSSQEIAELRNADSRCVEWALRMTMSRDDADFVINDHPLQIVEIII